MEHLINKHMPKGRARRQKETVQDSTRRGSRPQDGVASFNRDFPVLERGKEGCSRQREELQQRHGGFITTLEMLDFLRFELQIGDFEAFLWTSAKYFPFLSMHLECPLFMQNRCNPSRTLSTNIGHAS